MTIPEAKAFQNFHVSIDERAVFRLQGYTRPQDVPDERVHELYTDTLQDAVELLNTSGILSFYRIKSVDGQHISLSNGITLTGKNITRTMKGAEILCCGLASIGNDLEQEVQNRFDSIELASGLMLDSIGSEAAEGAAQFLDDQVNTIIRDRTWNRTPRMSPGYGSFDVREQKKLFRLFDSHSIGVSLTDSCIMVPRKSVSFIIGCGPKVKFYKDLSPCRVCDMEDCQVRDPHSTRCLH